MLTSPRPSQSQALSSQVLPCRPLIDAQSNLHSLPPLVLEKIAAQLQSDDRNVRNFANANPAIRRDLLDWLNKNSPQIINRRVDKAICDAATATDLLLALDDLRSGNVPQVLPDAHQVKHLTKLLARASQFGPGAAAHCEVHAQVQALLAGRPPAAYADVHVSLALQVAELPWARVGPSVDALEAADQAVNDGATNPALHLLATMLRAHQLQEAGLHQEGGNGPVAEAPSNAVISAARARYESALSAAPQDCLVTLKAGLEAKLMPPPGAGPGGEGNAMVLPHAHAFSILAEAPGLIEDRLQALLHAPQG